MMQLDCESASGVVLLETVIVRFAVQHCCDWVLLVALDWCDLLRLALVSRRWRVDLLGPVMRRCRMSN